jgi:putative hydrolase of the HAD superfamily
MEKNSHMLAVIFDLWDTLIYDLPDLEAQRGQERAQNMHDVFGKHKMNISMQDVIFAYQAVGSIIKEQAKQNKALTIHEQVLLICDTLRLKSEPGLQTELEEGYNKPNLTCKSPFVPYAVDTIDILYRKYKLALISNTERSYGRSLISAYPQILSKMSVFYFSDEKKLRKPHPETFLGTIKELGLSPNQCVMVGDNPETDCKAAVNLGLNAVYFCNPVLAQKSPFKPQITSLADLPKILEKI